MSNQLSQQSALWGILAIALNTVAAAPSRVLGFPTSMSFYLKASPWICLADSIFTLYDVTTSLRKARSVTAVRETLYKIGRERFDIEGAGLNVTSTPIRVIVFALGALPQAIKIFSCHGPGVVRTQLVAASYLTSFALNEILLFITEHPPDYTTSSPVTEGIVVGSNPAASSVERRRYLHGEEMSCVILLYTLDSVLTCFQPSGLLEYNTFFVHASICWSTIMLAFASRFGFGLSSTLQHRCGEERARDACFITGACGFILENVIPVLSPRADDKVRCKDPDVVMWQAYFAWSCGMVFAFLPKMCAKITFCSVNVACTILYCLKLYDAEATQKPAWTEWLG